MILVEEYKRKGGLLHINQIEVVEMHDRFNILKNNIHHKIVTLQFPTKEVDLKFLSCSLAFDFVEELENSF